MASRNCWFCDLVYMTLNLKLLDIYMIQLVTVAVCFYYAAGQQSEMSTHVARALPFLDISLSGSPSLTYVGVSKLRCIVECTRDNCSSFNFGSGTCELLHTYVCEESETLINRSGFRHYDVEFGLSIQFADSYRQTTPCTTLGKCSPKCYTGGSSTTSTAAPTTSQTFTTLHPGPGEVNYPCTTGDDCNVTATADCRNNVVCECIAGYSFNPGTKTCDTGCATYGSTFTLTKESDFFGTILWQNTSLLDRTVCQSECERTQLCVVFLWNFVMQDCYVYNVTKLDTGTTFGYGPFSEYWQRNCAD